MPWKLIVAIVIGLLVLTFVGLNWQNTLTVSFGFHVFEGVPTVIAFFAAFFAGLIIAVPFAIVGKNTRKISSPSVNPSKGMPSRDSKSPRRTPKINEDEQTETPAAP